MRGQPQELKHAILAVHPGHQLEQALEGLLYRIKWIQYATKGSDFLVVHQADHLTEQCILGAEVVIDSRPRHPRLTGDLGQRDAMEPLAGEQCRGNPQQLLASSLARTTARSATLRRNDHVHIPPHLDSSDMHRKVCRKLINDN
ncbi:hypothetical protein D9M71_725850 [compost metagenome]